MKKIIFSTLFVFQVFFVFAQQPTGISGTVVDAKTQKPLQNVIATIQNTNLTEPTNASGQFVFKAVPVGEQLLLIKSDGYKQQLMPIEIVKNQILDIGLIALEEDVQTTEQQQSLVTITDNDLGDDNSGSESTSSLLQATRDVFQQAAAFNWGQSRFKSRGLDNEYGTTMINGIVMNKIYDGRPQYSNWGGLNDATRNQEFTYGSSPSDYNFGGILGTNEINTRASAYRKGNRVSIASTNTNYTGRLMGTMVSGMRQDGWAYAISASRRFASNGYFDGTTYNANSLFASIEKKLTDNNSLNFTSIYGQNKRGKNSPNTQEVTNSEGEKYNSYWGYQAGEKRNSRVKTVEEPIFILTDYWKISPSTNLTTSVSYQFGSIGNSRIDFQGTNNPDPTYYRNMPSYFTSLYQNDAAVVTLTDPAAYLPGGLGGTPTPNFAAAVNPNDALFLGNKQLNWDSLYLANKLANNVGDGAKYVFYEDRTDDKQLSANFTIASQLSDNISLNAGANFRQLNSNNFKNLLDLLGANIFNDINLFGSGDQRLSDLNNPNRSISVGDKYGYNYDLNAVNYDAFTQFKFVYKKVDFYLGQSFSHHEYQREGLYKNGYYPNNSFGKSNKVQYDNFGFKGGFTYKITGRQFLSLNGAFMTKAPTLRNVFNNSRVNNDVTDGVKNERISSADVSYIINNPMLKTRLTAYYSKIENQTETSFFFGDGAGIDDPNTTLNESNTFVAETVTNLNKRNLGLELGIEYPITSTFKVTASAAYGEYIFDNNPNVKVSIDASAKILDYGEAKLKNYKQSGSPQTAGSFGLEYRDPKFWSLSANINYLGNNYIDIAPITRTSKFYSDPASLTGGTFSEATQERGDELLKQEKFKDFSLLNINGGKSWRIKDKTLGLNVNVSNVLDVKYKTGGFEQARNSNYRQLNQDVSSGTPAFAPKYFYGYGRTFFVNLYLNF
jgi:CarboxypepD_reg-like domain